MGKQDGEKDREDRRLAPPNIYSSHVSRTHPGPHCLPGWPQGPHQGLSWDPESGCCRPDWKADKVVSFGGTCILSQTAPQNEDFLSRYQVAFRRYLMSKRPGFVPY